MVDHLSPKALIDPIGGFSKQEGLEAAEHPFQDGDDNQGDPQHLQRVQTALADHLVDDHLDQQRVGRVNSCTTKLAASTWISTPR